MTGQSEMQSSAIVRVLLIEDNPGDVRLIQEMLAEIKAAGFEIKTADRVSTGLVLLARGGFDVVLLDLGLPDSQGLETLRSILAGLGSVPIVVLTSLADENIGIKAVHEGAQDYLIKGMIDGNLLSRSLRYAIERHRAEEEIRRLNMELERRVVERTAELEIVNQELEVSSYAVAHDLRAPLRSIDGFSQALLEDYASMLDAQGRDYLNRVRAASQRMAHLIDDLLMLSSVTRREMKRESIDLGIVARIVAAELQKTQPQRQVEFEIASGLSVNGDARLLQIVLENLLGNAWKFTSKHPRAKIEFGVMEHEGMPAYFVRDDGAGFDMEYADKLFGAFQRLHSPSEFPGTGIGLAIVNRIIHRHGGQVWAEGKVDKGATFYFTIASRKQA